MRASLLPNPPDPNIHGPRLYAVDIVRWFSFYAIVIYHLTFALWARAGLTAIPDRGLWTSGLETYARALAFSGFTVVFLSFFLFGFNAVKSRKADRLPVILLAFALVWLATVEEFPYWWDIYPYLLCALVVLTLVKRLKVPAAPLAFVSGVVLSIPFWQLETLAALPLWATTILTGACHSRADLGDWPLLPWLAYPLFAYALGQMACGRRGPLSQMSGRETLVWVTALAASGAWLGAYYHTPLGEEFGCYVFRRPALEFWTHQLWILLSVRLSLMSGVQRWLTNKTWVAWISLSPVNRRFFVIYFIHYPLAFAAAWGARQMDIDRAPWILPATFILLFLIVECHKLLAKPEAPWARTSAKSLTT